MEETMVLRKKKISVICPAFNESDVLEKFYREVSEVFDKLEREFDLEILVVDDGSSDRTLLVLRELAEKDERFHYVSLSRNFGHQAAVAAGLKFATGDAVITMDADLQHPPDLIPQMLELWKQGYHRVLTSREEAPGYGIKAVGRKVFFWLMNRWSKGRLNAEYSDFRLLSRAVVNSILELPERHQFMRGLVAYVGFPYVVLAFRPNERYAGASKFNFLKLFSYGLDALFSYSRIPLKISSLSGALLFFTSLICLGVSFFGLDVNTGLQEKIFIIGVVFFGTSLILLSQGISNEYLVRIFEQVQGRPLFFIKESKLPCEEDKGAPPFPKIRIL